MTICLRVSTLVLCLALATMAFGQVKDGVAVGPRLVTPHGNDFDPPCAFPLTLPLQGSFDMNPASRAYFALGNGAVLDECSNFSVTGYSAPNFLAWNCNATNFDGTTPALPEVIGFTGGSVTRVTVKIGSNSDQGETGGLAAFNAAFTVIGVDTVTLTPALQTVTTNATGTTAVAIFGPCIMVADDLTYN